MIKKLLHLLSLFSIICLNAQTYDEVIYGNPGFFLMYENEEILITTNGTDTNFSGFLGFRSDSQGSVTIKPELAHTIIISAVAYNDISKTLGAGTQVGGRPPLGGGGKTNIEITIFPNPAISTIQLKSTENIIGYKVYDSHGTQKTANSLLKSKQFSVNVSNLTPGIYHATILLENGQSISKQFIKQ